MDSKNRFPEAYFHWEPSRTPWTACFFENGSMISMDRISNLGTYLQDLPNVLLDNDFEEIQA
jgi:hypothetical protein